MRGRHASAPPDAVFFFAPLLSIFIQSQHVPVAGEDSEAWEWSYERYTVWLLLGYLLMTFAYAQGEFAQSA